jgi:hypothetical protein
MWPFFRVKPIVSETSAQWLETCFAWAIEHFDGQVFRRNTALVQPTNSFFPGRVDSEAAMAAQVLTAVIRHSGLQHWPWQLQTLTDQWHYTPEQAGLPVVPRGSADAPLPSLPSAIALPVVYHPLQCVKPGDLAGSFASLVGQHLLLQSRLQPPGGEAFFGMASEVVAVFLGFGVLLANSAYSFRGSCAKCYVPAANRAGELSESEVVYALALFIFAKNIPLATACQHLKPHLKRQLKSAYLGLEAKKAQLPQALLPAPV